MFYSLDAGFFQYHPGVKQFGPRSGPTFVGLDLGPNFLQRQQKLPLASKELNTKQLVDNTFWLNKKVNFIWLQLFPFG